MQHFATLRDLILSSLVHRFSSNNSVLSTLPAAIYYFVLQYCLTLLRSEVDGVVN